MSERLRSVRQSATDALLDLLLQHGSVTLSMTRPALYTVCVGRHHFDAGTVEEALNAAHLADPKSLTLTELAEVA